MHATRIAWQPFTPGGVASFAYAPGWHLLAAQLLVALLAAGTVIWFLATNCFPVITAAIQQLPPHGAVRAQELDWPGPPARVLAENRFLALAVDLDHQRQVRSPAHLQVEFGRRDVRCFSLFGMAAKPYPAGWSIAFNRPELIPWWGAWSPILLALAGAGVVAGLFVSWAILAAIHSPLAWLLGFFANRNLNLAGSWRLSAAALLPGALVMIITIVLYGLAALDLVKLLFGAALHLLVGWGFLVASVFAAHRDSGGEAVTGNPFGNLATPPSSEQGQVVSPALPPPGIDRSSSTRSCEGEKGGQE